MDNNFFKIDIDSKEIEDKLKGTTLKMKSISKKMMAKANAEVIKRAKQNARKQFKTSSKKNVHLNDEHNPPILKTLKKWNAKRKDWTSYVASRTLHGAALEKGFTATAKNGKYLTFKINGEWKKVEQITVAPKPFLHPAIDSVYGTGEYKKIMQDVLDAELKKYFEKQRNKK